MKAELIVELHSAFERIAQSHTDTGMEFWLARDLQVVLGYARWENFAKVIEKAQEACRNAGFELADHFLEVTKMVELGPGSQREVDIFERQGNERSFATIRSRGDQALFGGLSTQQMKDRMGIPASRPLADFLPTITIKAKDFANEITNFNLKKDDLRTEARISREHVKNNRDVRNLLTQRGIVPENLPAEEDLKKIERRHESDTKKLPKASQPSKP